MEVKINGLSYVENVIDAETEKKLVDFIESQPWSHAISRATQHYGYIYDYSGNSVNKTKPIPDILNDIADQIGVNNEDRQIDQIIINKYEPGQGIRSHIDNKIFDNEVACLSLQSAIRIDFEKDDDHKGLYVRRRSLLTMKDDARNEWFHGIVGRKSDFVNGCRILRKTRISVTFRKVI